MSIISKESVTTCFHHFCHAGFEQQFGIDELLAAIQAVAEAEETQLKETLKLLWCKSLADRFRFDQVWQEVMASFLIPLVSLVPTRPRGNAVTRPRRDVDVPTPARGNESERGDSSPVLTRPRRDVDVPTPARGNESYLSSPTSQLALLPVCVPPWRSMTKLEKLESYWPVSQREMVSTWRYLRRPLPAGNTVVLDIQETLKRTIYQGSGPSYRPRLSNLAHLLLLIDQNGSMMPFHPLIREIVKTVHASTIQVEIFYFQNLPGEYLYQEPHLLDPLETSMVWQKCSLYTNLLIISEAGAARSYRRPERVRETRTWLSELQKYTDHLVWLNPMPKTRWAGTSANWIAQLVPMFEISEVGFRQAIQALQWASG